MFQNKERVASSSRNRMRKSFERFVRRRWCRMSTFIASKWKYRTLFRIHSDLEKHTSKIIQPHKELQLFSSPFHILFQFLTTIYHSVGFHVTFKLSSLKSNKPCNLASSRIHHPFAITYINHPKHTPRLATQSGSSRSRQLYHPLRTSACQLRVNISPERMRGK